MYPGVGGSNGGALSPRICKNIVKKVENFARVATKVGGVIIITPKQKTRMQECHYNYNIYFDAYIRYILVHL